MNKVTLIGRITKDPQVMQNGDVKVARYTLAVDRRSREKSTDFISCVTFGKGAEFAENYLHQGMKIAVFGHIQTGSYTNRDGKKVYTTDVVSEEHEFCDTVQTAQETHRDAQQGAVDTFPMSDKKTAERPSEHGFEVFGEQEGLPFV